MTTGLDLKIERVRARVTAVDLAHAMGVSRQRISAIESLATVPTEAAERFRAALMSVTSPRQDAGPAVAL